eukprot:TRINITY_DN1805_c0_g2_i3.p1 TRINITY_DN1805_c0_g2~~TRINITY_DN1805_c0_g2_i3.p1  ORF type:complete len:691 (+),score=135.78 TRINITY_DN1805_c0_g2_i3:48-2075(+)
MPCGTTFLSYLSGFEALVPDTVIFENDADPSWVYTNKKGRIATTSEFTNTQILNKLGCRKYQEDLVAVKKLPQIFEGNTFHGNSVAIISTREMGLQLQANRDDEAWIIQRFIKSHGPQAFIVRTWWQNGKAVRGWTLTNTVPFLSGGNTPTSDLLNRFVASSRHSELKIVRIQGPSGYGVPVDKTKELVSFIESRFRRKIENLMVDFIKDDSNNWWLLQIRGLEFIPVSLTNTFSRRRIVDSLEQNITCGCCGISSKLEELSFEMTHKMISDMAVHLQLHLADDSPLMCHWGELIRNYDNNAGIMGRKTLSTNVVKVCVRCYQLYQQQLILLDTEMSFLNRIDGVKHSKKTGAKNIKDKSASFGGIVKPGFARATSASKQQRTPISREARTLKRKNARRRMRERALLMTAQSKPLLASLPPKLQDVLTSPNRKVPSQNDFSKIRSLKPNLGNKANTRPTSTPAVLQSARADNPFATEDGFSLTLCRSMMAIKEVMIALPRDVMTSFKTIQLEVSIFQRKYIFPLNLSAAIVISKPKRKSYEKTDSSSSSSDSSDTDSTISTNSDLEHEPTITNNSNKNNNKDSPKKDKSDSDDDDDGDDEDNCVSFTVPVKTLQILPFFVNNTPIMKIVTDDSGLMQLLQTFPACDVALTGVIIPSRRGGYLYYQLRTKFALKSI